VETVVKGEDLDARRNASIHIRLLGSLAIQRNGQTLTLPASRKARALFAYLALAPRPVTRSQLCELLWDAPDDPRGELRWCLSKIRSLVDEAGRRRVITREDAVQLALADCFVDALEVVRATEAGVATLSPERQQAMLALFEGDFLEGFEIERSPFFEGWLIAQRRRFRGAYTALLESLAKNVPDGEALAYLDRWLQSAPFDRSAHERLLTTLARLGRRREGEEHLSGAARLFEAEGIDCAPLREIWRCALALATAPRRQASPSVAPASAVTEGAAAEVARRASIAVMPFADQSTGTGVRGGVGDALAHDVITQLAKLRSLFVIAQGSVFALHERSIGAEAAGRMLNVDYMVSGSVRRLGERSTVMVELVETRSSRIIWADVFDRKTDDAFLVLEEIAGHIVACVVHEIEATERNRAILKPPNSLDAWEAHHRGLWHMYRFNRSDNELAQRFFETAVRLDPTFARAHAGRSFTHFQNAFQGWAERAPQIDLAFEAAGRSLQADDRDPAAYWAMGRALWLRGDQHQSVIELERAIDLSPNFALGHYALSFVHSQAGDPHAAISAADHSRDLSPFDPLLFAMLGARAMSLVRLGRFEEAAEWASKAAARPNAHAHILAIAAYSLALAGRFDEARAHAAAIRKTLPHYTVTDFLTAFRFDAHGAALFRDGASSIGMA
jgi:DNA-binding SARP family transcriptional activator/Flp pilus assembly protein TadD